MIRAFQPMFLGKSHQLGTGALISIPSACGLAAGAKGILDAPKLLSPKKQPNALRAYGPMNTNCCLCPDVKKDCKPLEKH